MSNTSLVRIVELADQVDVGAFVTIKGWVRSRRDSKEFSFVEVNDGSCLSNLQVVANSAQLANYHSDVLSAHTGAAVVVSGQIQESLGKGQRYELVAKEFLLVGFCPAENYPLQKKRHSFEFLRSVSHLRARTNTFGAVFRLRSKVAFAIHRFFEQRGFVYLHTPIISTSDCEGAGEMFRVTTLDMDDLPRQGTKVDFSQDFFGREANLTVSGQLEAEAFALALGKVYTFGPTFRAENSNTPRHLAEFWMIEPEVAFAELDSNMELAEDFIKAVIGEVLSSCHEDMSFFDQWIEKGIVDSLSKVVAADFARITYDEAIRVLQASSKKFEYPVEWGLDLQTEHERYLTDEHVKGPVFVTNYPKQIKAFYMKLDDGAKTVAAMDLLVPRLGEIIGGAERESRQDVLEERMKECGLSVDDYRWYLDLRRFGGAPHAGFGLGFERLLMYLSGMSNIRDIIPSPRTPGSADF